MKRFLFLLPVLCLLCCFASAETLTGRTGFTLEYPADMLEITTQYGTYTLLTSPDDSTGVFSLSILATVPGQERQDPVAALTELAADFDPEHSEVSVAENSKGATVWAVRYKVADSVEWDWIVQQDGREF